MKILHALAQRPGRTGSGVFLQQLFQAGFEKNHQQAVLAGVPSSDQNPNIENLDLKNYYPVLFESENLPFSVVGMSDIMPYNSTKYSDLDEKMYMQYETEFKKVIKKAVEKFNPDVVICNHIWLLATFIKDLYPNLKILTLCHGTDLRQLQRAHKLVPIVKKKIPRCEYFFALNSIQAKQIKEFYGVKDEQIIVSGSGYNPKMFFPIKREKNEKVVITYVGKICKAKGVKNLLNCINKCKNYDQIKLNLIGNGASKESEEIIKSIKDKKNKISYLGMLPQDQLEQRLRTSDIFILPSFFEGLPLVVIEALASGAKVICTDLPGLDDFLGEKLKKLKAIRYVKMPRLKNLDTPYEEDIKEFESNLSKTIDNVALEIIKDEKYNIDEVIKLLEDKTWFGLFEKFEERF